MVSVRSHLFLSPMDPDGRSRDVLVFCLNKEEVIVICKKHNVFIIKIYSLW